jgi:sodium-dependent dicarboxylate transporter 2/3/5
MPILLAIVWGAGVGGLGTPLGGAMNLVAIDYIQTLIGREYMFRTWVLRMLPFFIVLIFASIACLLLMKPKGEKLEGTKEYFSTLCRELPPMNRDEKVSLLLFVIAVILSFTRELYATFLPELKPAFVFIICGVIPFFIRKTDRSPMLVWKDAQNQVYWNLIFMFGGGIALGFMMSESGAIQSIASIILQFSLTGEFLMILIIVVFTMLLAEISSNTSAAAISIPIVISLTQGMDRNPIPYIYITIAAFNCAYLLPTSVRAIPVGYGLNPKSMLKKGILLFAASVAVITFLGYLLLKYWPAFSTV